MNVSELIEALKGHEGKRVAAAFLSEKDGEPTLAVGPFELLVSEEEVAVVPAIFLEQESQPKRTGLTKDLLERLIPKEHLGKRSVESNTKPCKLEKISGDANAIVAYMEEHNLMKEINTRSGQENDIRYMAYAIQAYYMGVLK